MTDEKTADELRPELRGVCALRTKTEILAGLLERGYSTLSDWRKDGDAYYLSMRAIKPYKAMHHRSFALPVTSVASASHDAMDLAETVLLEQILVSIEKHAGSEG